MKLHAWLTLLPLGALSGCGSIGSGAGAIAGIATGAGTANPVVGTAVALGTKAAVDALVLYISRSSQDAEQDAIAQAAGALDPGRTARWEIRHTFPVGNEHGTLTVASLLPNPLTPCKEVVFTVQDGRQRERYVTTECRGSHGWRWAEAEPATIRWGVLQ